MITASIFLGYDAKSFAHLYLGSFSHSSLQILSNSVRLDGERRCTANIRSLQRCSIGLRSGLELSHKDIQRLVPKPLLCYIGYVLKVIVLLEGEPSPQSEDALWSRISSRISLYFATFIFPSIPTSLPVPAAENIPTA